MTELKVNDKYIRHDGLKFTIKNIGKFLTLVEFEDGTKISLTKSHIQNCCKKIMSPTTWHQVVYNIKDTISSPCISTDLYKSKEHFLEFNRGYIVLNMIPVYTEGE